MKTDVRELLFTNYASGHKIIKNRILNNIQQNQAVFLTLSGSDSSFRIHRTDTGLKPVSQYVSGSLLSVSLEEWKSILYNG